MPSISDFLHSAFNYFPPFSFIDRNQKIYGSREPKASDYTIVQGHNGRFTVTLDHSLLDNVLNELDGKLRMVEADERIVQKEESDILTMKDGEMNGEEVLQGWLQNFHGGVANRVLNSCITFLRSVGNVGLARRIALYHSNDNILGIYRWLRPGSVNRLTSEEIGVWVEASKTLPELFRVSEREGHSLALQERNLPRPPNSPNFQRQPIPLTDTFPHKLTNAIGVEDMNFMKILPTGERGLTEAVVLGEVKLPSVVSEAAMKRLIDQLRRATVVVNVTRCGDAEDTSRRVFISGLAPKFTHVITQIFTGMAANKCGLSLFTTNEISLIIEYRNGGLHVSLPVYHQRPNARSLEELLVALPLYSLSDHHDRTSYPQPQQRANP
ncbi:hypothetical protein V865_004936 [Kwoniella europaea PYCC6329]|uniref:Uncharacterized protein n=1 Tax=Kwoniella europaea PYCC6329 TaxID=1423913 RepID=A0AAX4KMX3_9TREE